MSEKAELCSRIDSLVVDFFAKLSELDAKKAHLETVMADGFIQLSKTRYNMGGQRSVGASMYDRSNMTAAVRVSEVAGDRDSVVGDGGDRTVFQLVDPAKLINSGEERESGDAEEKVEIEKESGCDGDGLRKRPGAAKISLEQPTQNSITESSPEKLDKDDTIENLGKAVCDLKVSSDGMMELQNMKSPAKSPGRSPSSSSSNTSNDPIRWFGILVPQSLKISQRRFKTSIDLVVEIANLQLEIDCLQKQFKSMIKLKQSTIMNTEQTVSFTAED